MDKKVKIVYRVAFYLLGLLLLSAGSIFSINSGLGVSPVNALPYAVSVVSGVKLGTCVTAIFSLYIIVQVVLLRSEFKPVNLLQIVFSTLFGVFVNAVKSMLGSFCFPTYFGRLAMMCISIILVSLGLLFYLSADIVPMPMEGMTMTITKRLKRFSFHNVKIVIDSVSVLLACVITLAGLGGITGVREGTIIAAIVTGKVLALISKPLKPKLERICFVTIAPDTKSIK